MFRGLLCTGVLVVFPAVALAQQPCTTDARHVVDELYRHVLERPADAGSSGWVQRLQSGSTVRDVVHGIVDSPEHMQRFYNAKDGALANERAVGTFYRHILGRQPDAAGLRQLTDLAATRGLEAAAHAILTSDEYNRTLGDWGVPGSGGIRYCGNASSAPSSNFGARGTSVPQGRVADRDTFDMPPNDRFSYLDVNHNGVIDLNEWDGSLDAFYRLDRNNDGRLTRAEMSGARYLSPFEMLDLNGDGRITLGEWPYSHRSFDEQDVNGDGVITRQEFRVGALPVPAR